MPLDYFEEEEFESKHNGQTLSNRRSPARPLAKGAHLRIYDCLCISNGCCVYLSLQTDD